MKVTTKVLLILGLLSQSCAIHTRPAPPPSRAEMRAAAPCPGAQWESGNWRWEGKRIGYRWIPGHWRCP
jgi:hypothetical protein